MLCSKAQSVTEMMSRVIYMSFCKSNRNPKGYNTLPLTHSKSWLYLTQRIASHLCLAQSLNHPCVLWAVLTSSTHHAQEAERASSLLQLMMLGHSDWFERQKCSDCLAPLLGIDKLWQTSSEVSCKSPQAEATSEQAQENNPEGQTLPS